MDFLTSDVIANAAALVLAERSLYAPLVYRDFDENFRGAQGDTITVRKPAKFTAKTFNRAVGIELQTGAETGTPVRLDTLLDVSFAVTTEQRTLDIEDFTAQLLAPAMAAIAEGVDNAVLALRADVTQTVGVAGAEPANPRAWFTARRILNQQKAPLNNRIALLGPELEESYLNMENFRFADHAGTTEALREAVLGRVAGFESYSSPAISREPLAPNAEESLFFQRNAFALVTRTLELPRDMDAAVRDLDGIGVRVVQGYDITKKQHIVSVDCLIGTKTIYPELAVIHLR